MIFDKRKYNNDNKVSFPLFLSQQNEHYQHLLEPKYFIFFIHKGCIINSASVHFGKIICTLDFITGSGIPKKSVDG